jgi:putative membrane protein
MSEPRVPPHPTERRRRGTLGRLPVARDLRDVGEEPDPRFTLANERTFLAWIRTALALVAGGIAIGQFVTFDSLAAHLVAVLAPTSLAAVIAVLALRRWTQVERALRLREPLPLAGTIIAVTFGVLVLALAATVVMVLDATTG